MFLGKVVQEAIPYNLENIRKYDLNIIAYFIFSSLFFFVPILVFFIYYDLILNLPIGEKIILLVVGGGFFWFIAFLSGHMAGTYDYEKALVKKNPDIFNEMVKELK